MATPEMANAPEAEVQNMATPASAQVLVVEDERDIAALVAYHLTREGYRVRTVGTGDDALEAIRNERPDLVVLDEAQTIKNPESQAAQVSLTALGASLQRNDRGAASGRALLHRHRGRVRGD